VETVDEAMATAESEWRSYGVRRADRVALGADLRLDLESAAADGVGPAQLLGTDVRGFARRLADEAGVRRMPPEYARVVLTALLGAVLGAAVGALLTLLAEPLFLRMLDPPRPVDVPVPVVVTVYWAIPAAIVVAGAVATVRLRLRDLPRIHATARAMCVLLPIAGVMITPITMGFAWTTGYSTSSPVVVAEMALVAGSQAGATVLARRWSLRESADEATVGA
jgi:hypothetical protein